MSRCTENQTLLWRCSKYTGRRVSWFSIPQFLPLFPKFQVKCNKLMHDKIGEVSITLLFIGRKQIYSEQKITLSVTEWGKINTMKSHWMRLYSSQVGDYFILHSLVLQQHYLVFFAWQKTQEIFCLDFMTTVATVPCPCAHSASLAFLVWESLLAAHSWGGNVAFHSPSFTPLLISPSPASGLGGCAG